MATKKYPFSVTKHGHDIEYLYNHLFCLMVDAENGDVKMSKEEYGKLVDFLYGDLEELTSIIHQNYGVAWLTGKQIGIAKEAVAWASESRAQHLIERGDYEDLKYC